MQESPVISLIVPVYNAAGHVRGTLASALAQSLGNLEIVCIDDGSSDASRDVLADLARSDPRIRNFSLPTNQGASAARNEGIRQARGQYLFFLDSDDSLPPLALEHLLAVVQGTGCAMALGKLLWLKQPGDAPRYDASYPMGQVVTTSLRESAYLQSISGSHCCNLYRRDLLDRHGIRYDTDLVYGEDQLFQATAIAAAGRVALLDEVVYVYHHYHGHSITRRPTSLEYLLGDLEFHRRIARLLESQGLADAGTDFLRTWPYSIREYWLQIPDVLNLAQATTFFSAFRALIAEFAIIPWSDTTRPHHRHLLSLILEQRDQDAYYYLASAEARHGRAAITPSH